MKPHTMRFMRISNYAEKNKYKRICRLYEIRIHYADWEDMCAYYLNRHHADSENVSISA